MSSPEPELKNILSNSVLPKNDPSFTHKFNQESFQFNHHLAGNPLFEIPRLVELANLEIGRAHV